MKTAIFISVRMKSKRLPQKALLKIKGKATIEHLIDRVKKAKLPQMVVLCTSTHPDDRILVEVAVKNGIYFFQGSEDDKLDRYLKAAERFGFDFAVIVDGDDILCEPLFMDKIIKLFIETDADFIISQNLPLGAACAGIKVEALRRVCELKDETDTEVWGGYFTETGLFRVEYLAVEEKFKRPEVRMTLDYPEDFDFFTQVFEHLYRPGKVFSLEDVLALLEKKPELMEINQVVQKTYEEHLKKSAGVKLKVGLVG